MIFVELRWNLFLFYFSIRRHPENPTRQFFALPPDFSPSAAIEGRSDSRSSPLFLARNSPSHSGIASILNLQQRLQHYLIQCLPIYRSAGSDISLRRQIPDVRHFAAASTFSPAKIEKEEEEGGGDGKGEKPRWWCDLSYSS